MNKLIVHYPGKFPPKNVCPGGEASDIIEVGDQVLEWITIVESLVLYLETVQSEEDYFLFVCLENK